MRKEVYRRECSPLRTCRTARYVRQSATSFEVISFRPYIVEVKTKHQNVFLVFENDHSKLRILVYYRLEYQRIWPVVVTATIVVRAAGWFHWNASQLIFMIFCSIFCSIFFISILYFYCWQFEKRDPPEVTNAVISKNILSFEYLTPLAGTTCKTVTKVSIIFFSIKIISLCNIMAWMYNAMSFFSMSFFSMSFISMSFPVLLFYMLLTPVRTFSYRWIIAHSGLLQE